MEKKPILFEAACLFSLAGSSIGFLSMGLSAIFFKYVTEKIVLFTNITSTEHLTPLYFAYLMVAFAVSLAGAIKLYRMKKTGLFLYLFGQVAILFLPVILLGFHSFSVTNALLTMIFSGVYLFYYRLLY